MSIKDHALLVRLSVNKPQMTMKDEKATRDAENANNAHGAGQFRKDLYPKALIQPIAQVESSARSYIDKMTYPWTRGEDLLPTAKFMEFTERMGKYQLEFDQCVTAFLNNWSNVMVKAQQDQGDLFDANVYPDLTDMKNEFRFRVLYRPVTDSTDFRVQMQEEEMDELRASVEAATKESLNTFMREPLERLKKVVTKLQEVTARTDRVVVDKKTGVTDVRPPIFRDSVCENIAEEISLLHDFAEILPDDIIAMARTVMEVTPHPQQLRDNPDKRKEVNVQTTALLDSINAMLEN
ncbi:hypothetical protein UFOVP232_18 [uncultured Caudovirales phage]|uniref:DUF3150 domain-containing protein n=1 Tax=uncultured Caudovirales phage TaxID=2100421 RepID=A0A6J7WV52_9CAUD|nr:hypothetical protein UFOVP232_18 [uncultured Caudovirales phage]